MTPHHPKMFLHMGTPMVHVPVLLHWHYKGKSGKAPHEAIAMVSDDKTCFDISEYWWTDGNGGCDCNRVDFIGLSPVQFPELFWKPGDMYSDGSGPHEGEPDAKCGDSVCLSRIESLDPLIASLELDEVADDE